MNVLVAISKDVQAVKLYSNRILQFLAGCQLTHIDIYNGRKTVL